MDSGTEAPKSELTSLPFLWQDDQTAGLGQGHLGRDGDGTIDFRPPLKETLQSGCRGSRDAWLSSGWALPGFLLHNLSDVLFWFPLSPQPVRELRQSGPVWGDRGFGETVSSPLELQPYWGEEVGAAYGLVVFCLWIQSGIRKLWLWLHSSLVWFLVPPWSFIPTPPPRPRDQHPPQVPLGEEGREGEGRGPASLLDTFVKIKPE